MQSHLRHTDGDEFGGWDIRVLQHIDFTIKGGSTSGGAGNIVVHMQPISPH